MSQTILSLLADTQCKRAVSKRDFSYQKTYLSDLMENIKKIRTSMNEIRNQFLVVPTIGLEPTTYALRVRCTTNCATSALKYNNTLLVQTNHSQRFFSCNSI